MGPELKGVRSCSERRWSSCLIWRDRGPVPCRIGTRFFSVPRGGVVHPEPYDVASFVHGISVLVSLAHLEIDSVTANPAKRSGT